jgi:sugar lactone lactonase YvrE
MNRCRGLSKLLTRSLFTCASFSLCVSAQTRFGTIDISSSKTESIAVTLTAEATLTDIDVLTEVVPNQDFVLAPGGTCMLGKQYAKGETCTAEVTFKPRAAGTRHGALVLRDYGLAQPQQVVVGTTYLQGDGVGPQTTFRPGTWNSIGEFGSGLPAVALDGNGNVYIALNTLGCCFGDVYIETRMANGSYVQSDIYGGYSWNAPNGIAVDGAGNVYVTDPPNVYKDVLQIGAAHPQPDGYRQFLVGSGWIVPSAIAVDGGGNVYVVDSAQLSVESDQVIKERPQPDGSYVASTVAKGFVNVTGVAVDGNGNVYVSDSSNGAVYKETPSNGKYEQTIVGVFNSPSAVAVDRSGNLYVTDEGGANGSAIIKVTRLNGSYFRNTLASGGDLVNPNGLAVDGEGNLFVGDVFQEEVWEIDLADPPSLQFDSTKIGSTSADSPEKIEVSNSGNATLKFSGVSYPTDFPKSSKAADECTANTSLTMGGNCNLTFDFSPVTPTAFASDPLTESVMITTDTLNARDTEQASTVTGVELSDSHKATATVNLEVSANPSSEGSPLTITAKVKGARGVARPTGTVVFYSGAASLGTALLNGSGLALLTTRSLTVGCHIMTATYSGDSGISLKTPQTLLLSRFCPRPRATSNPERRFQGNGIVYELRVVDR